jgi:hypothetical protein
MATKKTSVFTLTERVTLTAAAVNTPFTSTIDIASYVDVGDRQALQIHAVDFVFQGATPGANFAASLGNGQATVQVTDLNRGGIVFANDRALVASAALVHDNDAYLTKDVDFFPDNFGKGSDDGRYVVNDQLYVTAVSTSLPADMNVTVMVQASIVSLTAKDFMAIAIQSTAADN